MTSGRKLGHRHGQPSKLVTKKAQELLHGPLQLIYMYQGGVRTTTLMNPDNEALSVCRRSKAVHQRLPKHFLKNGTQASFDVLTMGRLRDGELASTPRSRRMAF